MIEDDMADPVFLVLQRGLARAKSGVNPRVLSMLGRVIGKSKDFMRLEVFIKKKFTSVQY